MATTIKIYDDDVLTHHLVWCRNPEGRFGWYDIFVKKLYKNNIRHQMLVHRLVAKAFIKNPNDYPFVNHIDENKENNQANNLEWCTQKYNMNYGTCSERIGKANSRRVVQCDKDGKPICEYVSIISAERMTGVSNGNIGDCLHGRRKSAGGYTWQYAK